MVQQQRGHQQQQQQEQYRPVAGPSSPPKGHRASQHQARHPRRSGPFDDPINDAYGYGNSSEFGSKPRRNNGEDYSRAPGGSASPPYGSGYAHASTSRLASQNNHYYAISAPLPPARSPLPPSQALNTMPPIPQGPRSSRLQTQGSSRLSPVARASAGPSASSTSTSMPPLPAAKRRQSPPPPPSSSLPSSSSFVSKTSRPLPPATASPFSTSSIPSAPRAMLSLGHNPLKGKGPSVSNANGDVSSVLTTEELARAALSKPTPASSSTISRLKPSSTSSTTNGIPTQPRTTLKIAISNNNGLKPRGKQAFAVLASSPKLPASGQTKHVNVLEEKERQLEKVRQDAKAKLQDEEALKAVEELKADAKAYEANESRPVGDEVIAKALAAIGGRYTPPLPEPLQRQQSISSREAAEHTISFTSGSMSTSQTSRAERSHTPPPRAARRTDRGYTPPPRTRQPVPPSKIRSPTSLPNASSSVRPSSSRRRSPTPPPPPSSRRSASPPPPSPSLSSSISHLGNASASRAMVPNLSVPKNDNAAPLNSLPSLPTPASPNTPTERFNSSLYQKPKAASISLSLALPSRSKSDTPAKRRNLFLDEPTAQKTEAKQETSVQLVDSVAPMQEGESMSDAILPDSFPPSVRASTLGTTPTSQVASEMLAGSSTGVDSMSAFPETEAVPPKPVPVNWLTVRDQKGDGNAQQSIVKRLNGKGVIRPVLDPRGTQADYHSRLSEMTRASKVHIGGRLSTVTYDYDRHSLGPPPPPPPSGILVANIARLTTMDKILAHFSQYGEIGDSNYCIDDLTGGFLGLVRIKYVDEIERLHFIKGKKPRKTGKPDGQDGHLCAKMAVARNHRQKVMSLAGNSNYLIVVLDGDGSLCKQEVRRALSLKYAKPKKEEPTPVSQKPATPSVVPMPLPNRPQSIIESKEAKPLPAGDTFIQRAVPTRDSQRTLSDHTSPTMPASASRGPYRLPPASRRSQHETDRSRARRNRSDRDPRSGSDSDTASELETEDQSTHWDDKKDRIYDSSSRAPRRRLQPSKAIDISRADRFHIAAMDNLSKQTCPYVTMEKKELKEAKLVVAKSSIHAHFRGGAPVVEVFEDEERFYITFKHSHGARTCYNDYAGRPFGQVQVVLGYHAAPTPQDVKDLEDAAGRRVLQTAEAAMYGSPAGRSSQSKRTSDVPTSPDRSKAMIPLTAREVARQARRAIISELEVSFNKDLRQRLAAPHVTAAWHRRHVGEKTSNLQSTSAQLARTDIGEGNAPASGQETVPEALQPQKGQPYQVPPEVAEHEASDETKGLLPSFGKEETQGQSYNRDARMAANAYALKKQSGRAMTQDDLRFTGTSVDTGSQALQAEAASGARPGVAALTEITAGTVTYAGRSVSPKERTLDVSKISHAQRSPRKTPKKSRPRKAIEVLHFTSSEEDSEGEDVPLSKTLENAVSTAEKTAKESFDVIEMEMPIKMEETAGEEETVQLIIPMPAAEESAPLEAVIHLPTPAPSESVASSTKRELSDGVEESAKRPRLVSPPVLGPTSPVTTAIIEPLPSKPVKVATRKAPAKGRVKGKRGGKQKKKASVTPTPEVEPLAGILTGLDQEDLFYLKVAIQRQKRGLPLPPSQVLEEEEDEDIQVVEPRHETGSARTEGYYKIPQAEKLRYLLARNQGKGEPNKEGNSSLSVSRLARVNARHLASGLDKHKKATATDTDLLQLNQLRTRKKQLRFARSPIHDWGLYALEHIPAGEMVIEYVGEQIRQQVADKREKAYERQGIGSSYLFRVDDDVVIDATMKGNLGRLINHCCTPNCTAKILSVGNSKKIVIYAKQVINKGDEITYDYHFPIEDEKIVCLCGSSGCRGFLN